MAGGPQRSLLLSVHSRPDRARLPNSADYRCDTGTAVGYGHDLTFSRTGLIIVVTAVLWLLYGRKLRALGAVVAVGAMAYGIENIPAKYRLIGHFSERAGSDALRERIVAAEERKLDAAPWFGNGPGTSTVEVRDQTFFFHSSYYGALNEGGWLLLGLIIVLVVAVFLALSRSSARGQLRTACLQMSLVAAMMMAFTLGEVLLDLPLAVALGFAIRHASLHPRRTAADQEVLSAAPPVGLSS